MRTTLSKVKNSSFLNETTLNTSNQLDTTTNDVSMAFMTEAHIITDNEPKVKV